MFILDELKSRISLNVDEMDKLSKDELKNQVDRAVKEVSEDYVFSSSSYLNRKSILVVVSLQ